MGKAFEVKDLGRLKCFLGIEVARSAKGIALSQRKYTLDLLSDVGMLGCRAAPTPIDQNHKVTAQSGEPVDRGITDWWEVYCTCVILDQTLHLQ